MTSVDSPSRNRDQVLSLLNSIPMEQKLDFVSFPENALQFRIREEDQDFAMDWNDLTWADLENWSQENETSLHIGGTPLRLEEGTFNCTVWINSTGERRVVYKKCHLFDVEVMGQKAIRESASFDFGPSLCLAEFKGWRLGFSICYDLRFSEMYAAYAREDVDLILIPSAFLVKTGEAHWQTLNRARAIESQAYVLSAAQAGDHKGVNGGLRRTYGESLLVDPWGDIVVHGPKYGEAHAPTLLIADLDYGRCQEVRTQIPMANHRKPKEFYQARSLLSLD